MIGQLNFLVPMDTKVPLHTLLNRFVYLRDQKLIGNELMKSVLGRILKPNTPYDTILKCHPINPGVNVQVGCEQQICDKLNEYLEHLPSMDHPLLTLKTPVDLKHLALEIGCCLF